jgi:predicted RNA-binding protein YlqC (UPF0109 family)
MENLFQGDATGLWKEKTAVFVTVDRPAERLHRGVQSARGGGRYGTIIGKQGRVAKAIRTVARAAANRVNQKIVVEID